MKQSLSVLVQAPTCRPRSAKWIAELKTHVRVQLKSEGPHSWPSVANAQKSRPLSFGVMCYVAIAN